MFKKRFNYGIKNLEEWLIAIAIVLAFLLGYTVSLFW